MAQHQYSNDQEFSSINDLPLEEEEAFLRSSTDDFQQSSAHLATLVEKKRLWWRNAVTNTLFILSWYALAHYFPANTGYWLATGFFLQLSSQYTTNGCSRRIVTDFLLLFLLRQCTCLCNLYLRPFYDLHGRLDFVRCKYRPVWNTGEFI